MAKEVDVITQIKIKKPKMTVAAYIFNPDNAPEWYVNISSVEWQSEKPAKEGSLVTFKAGFMGRKLEYTYEFIELVPNKKLVMRTAEGPFPMQTTYTLDSDDEGYTIVTLRNNGMPTGFSKIMAPLMTKMMRKANEKDLKLLKQILEK